MGAYDQQYFDSRRMGRLMEAPYTIHDRRDSYAHGLQRLVRLSAKVEVLDLGCGLGQGAWWLSRRCRKVTGIDASQFAIQFAQEIYRADNLSFRHGDVLNLELAPATYDLILIMDLLEHLKTETQVPLLRKCLRWLRPHGRLLIHAPIGESIAARWSRKQRHLTTLDHTGDPTHLATLSVRKLRALLAEAAFRKVKEEFTYSRFVVSRSKVRWLGSCLGWFPPLRNQLVTGVYVLAEGQGEPSPHCFPESTETV